MVRFDDIPRTFWLPKEDSLESADTREAQPLNESQPDEIKDEEPTRPPKTFPSKFGTYLEPVSEEVELSSQGSYQSNSMTKLSFESNRSTLKAGSQDSLSQDNVAKIPSLSDLWQTTEDEENPKSYDDSNIFNDYGDSIPVRNISGVFDNGMCRFQLQCCVQ